MRRYLTIPITASLMAGCIYIDADEGPKRPDAPALSETTTASPAQPELEHVSPEAERLSVGLAGEDPANIGRYLLASGASAPSLSPDGTRLAWQSSVTGLPQVWLTELASGDTRQLTFGNGVTFFRWAPDGASLVYGADNDGNEQEAYYRLSADGETETLLLAASEGGFRNFGDISPDGSTIVFASTERNGLDFDIYTADLETGATTRVFEGTYGFTAHDLSPDGTKLVVSETVGEDSDNLYLLDLATGDMTTLSRPEPRANHTNGGIAWVPDGSGFYLASNVNGEFASVLFYALGTDGFETVIDTPRDTDEVELCGAGATILAYTVNEDGFHRLAARDLATGEDLAPPALPEGVYTLSCAETGTIAIGVNGWRTPGDVYLWDTGTGAVTQAIASQMAGLDPDRLVRPESVRMTAEDGVQLQGLLYLPDETSRTGDGPPPVIFFVHGGPTGQSAASFDPVVQYHVDRGLAVFEPNVRGSTGFGRTYVTLDDRRKRRDSVRDLIDMLDALEADGRVDTSRAAVVGGSYGGYMVNAVLALYPDAFDAGVSLYGIADWVTALQVASPALKAADRIEYGDISEPEWLEFYTENSPIRLAGRIRVPVLFSHGVMDPRIDIAETETMVRALRANGIDAPFIRIPDEGHGWRKLSNRLFYFRRQAAFLEAQLAAEE